jgi:hypothetical protein
MTRLFLFFALKRKDKKFNKESRKAGKFLFLPSCFPYLYLGYEVKYLRSETLLVFVAKQPMV